MGDSSRLMRLGGPCWNAVASCRLKLPLTPTARCRSGLDCCVSYDSDSSEGSTSLELRRECMGVSLLCCQGESHGEDGSLGVAVERSLSLLFCLDDDPPMLSLLGSGGNPSYDCTRSRGDSNTKE